MGKVFKVIGIILVIAMAALGTVSFITNMTQIPANTPTTELTPTPTPTPTATPVPTEPTPTPTPTPTATPVSADNTSPVILAGKVSESLTDQGEYLDTYLGERITFTCRKVIVPDKAYNETLTKAELKAVQTTWVNIRLNLPKGMTAVVFGTKATGNESYHHGLLMNLTVAGQYNFRLLDGEVVVWYPGQDQFKENDITSRIAEQIRNGNFDIKSELDFFNCTADLLTFLPNDLVEERNVQEIPAAFIPTTIY